MGLSSFADTQPKNPPCKFRMWYPSPVLFSVQLAREVLDVAARAIRPGVTTDEIDRMVHEVSYEACYAYISLSLSCNDYTCIEKLHSFICLLYCSDVVGLH